MKNFLKGFAVGISIFLIVFLFFTSFGYIQDLALMYVSRRTFGYILVATICGLAGALLNSSNNNPEAQRRQTNKQVAQERRHKDS